MGAQIEPPPPRPSQVSSLRRVPLEAEQGSCIQRCQARGSHRGAREFDMEGAERRVGGSWVWLRGGTVAGGVLSSPATGALSAPVGQSRVRFVGRVTPE